jgi:hypothetical protein
MYVFYVKPQYGRVDVAFQKNIEWNFHSAIDIMWSIQYKHPRQPHMRELRTTAQAQIDDRRASKCDAKGGKP